MQRQHFAISRQLEYFTDSELNKQIGCSRSGWSKTLIKEMIDNALDACESIGVEPHIKVIITQDSISVQDNGSGIPAKVIQDSLDFSVKVSDKAAYVSPSRGQQGNALKCLYAVPYVVNGEQAQIEIHSNKVQYLYTLTLNKITQTIDIESQILESDFVESGSFFKVHNFNLATLVHSSITRDSIKQELITLLLNFSLCNCHANFEMVFDDDVIVYPATAPQQKWTIKAPLVSHWYTPEKFINLIARNVAVTPDMSINDFIKQFNGIKAPPKMKKVTARAGINSRDGLRQFVVNNENGTTDIDNTGVLNLLDVMNSVAAPVNVSKLGQLSKPHLERILNSSESEIYEHKSGKGETNKGLPYSFDVVFQTVPDDAERYQTSIICLNHSVLINGRITALMEYSTWSLNSYIGNQFYIEQNDQVKLFIHIVCPTFNFTGMGKNEVVLDEDLFTEIIDKIRLVSQKWTSYKKSLKREAKASTKEMIERSRRQEPQYLSQKEAFSLFVEDAYIKAAGNVKMTKCRQIYYAMRPELLKATGKASIDEGYFRIMLKDFMRENPQITENWDVLYDARGTFIEPHNGKRVPLGTLEVRNYVKTFSKPQCDDSEYVNIDIKYTSPDIWVEGPNGKYKNVLFIEKEGFEQILTASRIQDRYDIALMSGKGMSTDAARDLAEILYSQDVRILALHDFDIAGLTIARTLSEDTAQYQFSSQIEIIDIGLRLEDIDDLQREPVPHDRRTKDPRQKALNAGATEAEAGILAGRYAQHKGYWIGERVELNAMTSDQFVNFVELKLDKYEVKKVVPDEDILKKYFKASCKASVINQAISPYVSKIRKNISDCIDQIEHDLDDIEVPANLQELIEKRIQGSTESWIRGLQDLSFEMRPKIKIKNDLAALMAERSEATTQEAI